MRQSRRRTRAAHDDQALASTVATLLILASLGLFIVYFNATWVPVYVENSEATYAANLQYGLLGWADKGEALIAQGVLNQPFSASVELGTAGIPILGQGASSGTLSTTGVPLIQVFAGTNSTPVATATGGLNLQTATTQYPVQTLSYIGGGFQVSQGSAAWVNPRGLFTASRVSTIQGNNLTFAISSMTISAGFSTITSNSQVTVQGTVTSIATGLSPGGSVHIQIKGVSAPSWRAGLNRTIQSNGLTVDPKYWPAASGPNVCTTSSSYNFCYDGYTNSPTTVDLWVLHVQPWTYRFGTTQATLQT
ncbi:MAG: hypothetical protein ACYDDF_02530 [Thermoplasmatota archaeon]